MALQTNQNITQADIARLAEQVRPTAARRFPFAIDVLTGRPTFGTLTRGSEFRRQLAALQQARSPAGQIQAQLGGVLAGLPQAFDPETFLTGFAERQRPVLAGAREQLQSQLAARGLTGTGAEVGALTGLEAEAGRARTQALSEFLLRRPSLQLGALQQAAGIVGALRTPIRRTPFERPGAARREGGRRRPRTFPGIRFPVGPQPQQIVRPL